MQKQFIFYSTHIHLADRWREGEGGLPNSFLQSGACRELSMSIAKRYVEPSAWDLPEYKKYINDSPVEIVGAVFVECMNESPIQEAKWALEMCTEENALVVAVVAHIPVPEGGKAVDEFLNALRDEKGQLPPALKGGRVVLLDNPLPPHDACLAPLYIDGLKALSQTGLLWEWCCVPSALPFIAQVCAQFPNMVFILDHLGHNDGGEDFEQWQGWLSLVAANPNVFAKLGAVEEWGCRDPAPFLDFAIRTFGYQRCLYESNWFVSAAAGVRYGQTAELLLQSLTRLGASPREVRQVFQENASRVYNLK